MIGSRLIALFLIVLLPACVSSSSGAGSSPSQAVRDPSRRDTSELRWYTNLYDAVASRRPDWLRPMGGDRGVGGSPVVGVFLEGQRLGHGPEYLRELRPGDVVALRHIPASESLHTYGFDWAWGGIVVTLRR